MTIHVEKSKMVNLTSLIVRERYLHPTQEAIAKMMKSLELQGQIAPILIRHVTSSTYRLVVGATRFEAAKRLGWKAIRADIISVDHELQYQMIELSENLDRRDLSAEQRRKMKDSLREYQTQIMEGVEPAKGGRGKKGGISEAARKVGVSEGTARNRKRKPRNNTKTCEVSAEAADKPASNDKPAAAPAATDAKPTTVAASKSGWERYKIVFDMSLGDVRSLDAFIKANDYESRSECIRAAVRKFIGLGEARAA